MAKNQLDDFAATLTAQLKDAAEQMRSMRTPPEHSKSESTSTIPTKTTSEKIHPAHKRKQGMKIKADKKLSKKINTKREQIDDSKDLQKNLLKESNPTYIESSIIPSSEEASVLAETKPAIHSDKLSSTVTNCSEQSTIAIYKKQMQTGEELTEPNINETMSKGLSSNNNQQSSNSHQQFMPDINCHSAYTSRSLHVIPSENLPYIQPTKNTFTDKNQLLSQNSNKNIHKQSSPMYNTTSAIETSCIQYQTQSNMDSHQQTMTACDTNNQSQAVPWGYFSSDALSTVQINTATIGGARQIVLDALMQLKKEFSTITINLKRLAAVLGLSYGTVRNTISRLVREGVIYTTQIRTGDAHGVYIEFAEGSPLLPSVTVTQLTHPQHILSHQEASHQQTSPSDSQANPIWNVDNDMLTMLWPYAVTAGLTCNHLEHLKKVFHIQQFDDTCIAKYLRYVNWKIEKEALDEMQAKTILQQWIKAMQQHGAYPCPIGYNESEELE